LNEIINDDDGKLDEWQDRVNKEWSRNAINNKEIG